LVKKPGARQPHSNIPLGFSGQAFFQIGICINLKGFLDLRKNYKYLSCLGGIMLTLDRGITSRIRLKGFGLVWHIVRKLGKNPSYVMLIRYSIIPHCKHVKR